MVICSVVKHLRDLHGEVQTLCGLQAEVADGTVAGEAADAQTPAEVAVVRDVQERLQDAALAAAQEGAQRPDALVTASHHGPQTVQRMTEEAGQEDRSTEVSERDEKREECFKLREKHVTSRRTAEPD